MPEGSALSAPATASVMKTQRTFAAIPSQVGQARRYLASLADGHNAADDALTCLSELATNAVIHSDSGRPGGIFEVCFIIGPGRIRVEVADQGGPWQRRYLNGDDQGGRGLAIVAALASSWGITGDRLGRTAWCELDYTAADSTGVAAS